MYSTVTRRDFLKMMSAVGGSALLPPAPREEYLVGVPPTLMLHSADAAPGFLTELVACLREDGFTTTTYRAWHRRLRAGNPVARPVILTIDDISLARGGCSQYDVFVRMHDEILAAAGVAVFGVITQPVINGAPRREQDPARWDVVRGWVDEGFELASHTTYHSNFNAGDSGPRADFGPADYTAEIVDSARLIEAELGRRGVDYRVESLILPYGSGYSYRLPEPALHSGIVAACRQARIRFVAGIPHGRAPVPAGSLLAPDSVTYLGRIPPAMVTEVDGRRVPAAALTAAWLRAWWTAYDWPVAGPGLAALFARAPARPT